MGIACYVNSQETVIVDIKKNTFRKIKTAVEDKKLFSLSGEFSIIYQNKEDEDNFYHIDLLTLAEQKISKEEGERLEKFKKDAHNVCYNIKTQTISGCNTSKTLIEDLKMLHIEGMWGYEKPEEKFQPSFSNMHGKHEILTNRLMAYLLFHDKIHLFDLYTLRTTIIQLEPENRFITFFNQVDEDQRKISFIEVLPNEEAWISHIWLSEIEDSHEKSISKIERKAVHLKGLKIPANAHRIYWEEQEEV